MASAIKVGRILFKVLFLRMSGGCLFCWMLLRVARLGGPQAARRA